MSIFFTLLLLASIVCFFIGLISPKVFAKWFGKNISRKGTSLIFGFLSLASLVSIGVTASPAPKSTSEKAAQPVQEEKKPEITAKEEVKVEEITFSTETKDDPTLEKGQTKVQQEGVNGSKEFKHKVTYTDGKETGRELISETVKTEPVPKIVLNGTKEKATTSNTPSPDPRELETTPKLSTPPTSNCDPNYSGACVPIDSDVDCAGGSGNGPSYVKGPVYIIGNDKYKLDSDGDGVACEK